MTKSPDYEVRALSNSWSAEESAFCGSATESTQQSNCFDLIGVLVEAKKLPRGQLVTAKIDGQAGTFPPDPRQSSLQLTQAFGLQ